MKIAVMGSAPSSIEQAPFKDKSFAQFQQGKPAPQYPPSAAINDEWDIWGCSPGLFGAAERATRWFELHRWEPGKQWFSPEYVQWLKDFKGPVYVGGDIPEITNAVRYPVKMIEDEFSAFFLTSSLALMHALAILTIEDLRLLRRLTKQAQALEEADRDALDRGLAAQLGKNQPPFEPYGRLVAMGMKPAQIHTEMEQDDSEDIIGLWGVDMSATEEYSRQRPGCWYFGLQTLERGIGLFYPPESDLFIPEPIYGLCEWEHEYIKAAARMKELTARRDLHQRQVNDAQANLYGTIGAVEHMNYTIRNWMARDYRLPAGKVLRRTKVR